MSGSLSLLPLSLPVLRAENGPPCVADWEPALRYGQYVHSALYGEFGPDQRYILWLTFRKRLLLFIGKRRGDPGALEPIPGGIAWHGDCIVEIASWFP